MHPFNKFVFTKMHGLGNDIVIVDCQKETVTFTKEIITSLADRHTGIGFDQLITIEPSQTTADCFCQIFNPDGSTAEQCGNGLRCVARYLSDHQPNKNALSIETVAGIFKAVIQNDGNIAINMNSPIVLQEQLLLDTPTHGTVEVVSLSLGNPHIITRVETITHTMTETIGAALSTHAHFPEGTNVGFIQIHNQHTLTLRTYERGAGCTLACGSNACAAVVAGIVKGWLRSPVQVQVERGSLTIQWNQEEELMMIGPAHYCFEGHLL